MKLSELVIGAIAVVGVVLGGLALANLAPQESGEKPYSAASSPIVNGGCMEVNGATECYFSQAMKKASTTCAFKNPLSATTTLVYAGAKFNNVAAGGFDAAWGKARNSAFATTTTLGYAGVITGDIQATIYASTTPVDLSDPVTAVAPDEWVNFKIGSSTLGVPFAGVCTAVFRSI